MLKATIEIQVTTSTNQKGLHNDYGHTDPHNWWSVRLTSKTEDTIRNILEQDFRKSDFDKAQAANQMIENMITKMSDLVFGD